MIDIKQLIDTDDLATFDPYDIWKSKLGYGVKALFNFNKYLGLIPAATLTIFDDLNDSSRIGYKKQEYPIVRAFAALTALRCYQNSKVNDWLIIAKRHLDWLMTNKAEFSEHYSWGINFKLSIKKDLVYPANVGFTTITPYALEAFDIYYQITQDESILPVFQGVYEFLENDIQIMYEDDLSMATSYGPSNDRIVTNSASYTMYSYAILSKYINNKEEINSKINKLYKFISKHQNEDGSWLYEPLSNNSFVDCFHSCFVLKNIIKTNTIISLEQSDNLIYKGIAYLKNNFFDSETGLYKRFSLSNKPSFIKWDLYDNAEMLNVLNLTNDIKSARSLNASIEKHFISRSRIYSQINYFNKKRKKDTLRWAVMPYIYALTYL
ncbi:hypothetical protein [Psychroserpens sp.]|uniref:hypothetical protein n=1 Tax=Psychroserpens sp. TaxID=2020870 RepID=UPI001B2B137D|nr:hypothetical protein [Psychroserpens sp.]MBO6605397.1 hypothetical protein [Psychroserpens sp.]MBO6630173.1 hypothetical protein [Psychroserpens sp.]MBO6653794.1 hypothetical protein [Psychroserpens sp.]MBO6682115.1 hypothetical protein [Psychroserpens sp.]MBO6748771.1 hypothetical protein [Psychroserpens sp.]